MKCRNNDKSSYLFVSIKTTLIFSRTKISIPKQKKGEKYMI